MKNSNSSSSAAIAKHAKSGKRYEIRNNALWAVYRYPACTATEIAGHVLDSKGIDFSNFTTKRALKMAGLISSVLKRISDLVRLGYIVESSRRECEVTDNVVAVYSITEKGADYLRSKSPSMPAKKASRSDPVVVSEPVKAEQVKAGRSALAGLRASLG